MKKLYTPREVARLFGISRSRIRCWARLGLVPHVKKPRKKVWFTFQGLVALRTIKELREQGVSLHKIRRCVEKLRRRCPEIKEPLSEVRFSAARQKIVLSQKKRRFDPNGQLHLDFSGEGSQIIPLAASDPGALFLQALDSERQGSWEEAREKYAVILSQKPGHPDALVNLGNILYRRGFMEGAEAHYRQALKADSAHVEANFNLANLLEEKGELNHAIKLYQQAMEADPEFAEAYFNLARVLEKQGNYELAKEFWRIYLELDPAGEWAAFLKKRLDEE